MRKMSIGVALIAACTLTGLDGSTQEQAPKDEAVEQKQQHDSATGERARRGPADRERRQDRRGEEPRPGVTRLFEAADADKDGKVSKEDLRKVAPNFPDEAFERMDQNKDSMLTRDELSGARGGAPGEMRQRLLDRADKNEDGKVSKEEFKEAFPNAPEERFSRLDTNGDGVFDDSDAPAMSPARRGAGPGAGPGQREGGGVQDLLRRGDTNSDGKVSREEFSAAMPNAPVERFDDLDRNGDGALTRQDFRRDRPGIALPPNPPAAAPQQDES